MRIPRAPTDGAPSAKFGLSLLGGFELTGPDGVVDLPGGKLAGLLAYLACTAPKPQSRERLSTLLWGSHFDAQAKNNLRQALSRLRRILGQNALESDGDSVWLNTAAVQCDVSRFEALIREGSREALSAAADLYRGKLIDDVALSEEGWSDWLTAERERLLDLALGALMVLGEQELDAGRAEQALRAGRRAISLNNMREDAHRLIVRALVAAGRKAEALKYYQDLVALLRRELNTEPDAATRSLAAELRATPPSGAPQVKTAKPTLPASPAARSDDVSSAAAVRSASPPGSFERRQLTIIAVNLVDSMALSARLDPEDMRDLIETFYGSVAATVSRFGGYVAQTLGDGVLVYFGYPAAHEHDAEQAVRAGLAIVDAVGTVKASSEVTLRARVGIATGLVVVGEQLGTGDTGQRVAIGETPDQAARLQAVAAPGEVVIATSTRRLVGRMFDCHALDADELEAWQVHGEATGVSRFEARRAGARSPLVGRQEEIELLLRRWDQAKQGEGRVVLLSGEPGIGKSCIAESLLARLEGERHGRLRYFCSPHHVQSALYPFIRQLERAADFEPGSSAEAKLDRLEALLTPTARNVPRDVALIAELLGMPAAERYPALAVGPQQKREMTLAALLDQLDGMAAQDPVLIVLEDAHWIDPTSQDLLDRTVARVASLPVLLVVTVRPELEPAWIDQPHVTMLPLSRLGRRDSAAIVGGVTRGKALPDAVVEQVLARTDGVPLFIEELTNTLLESGLLRETQDSYVLNGPLPPLAIPTTLQASLVARLDRLGSLDDVAQIGAALGREFSHELIAAVSGLSPSNLDAALDRLTQSGLISRRGSPPEATYTFKHALVQDAAYATMLRSRRRQLHAGIATVLVERFPAMAETLPQVVAHHFAEAALADEAIGWWRKAGQLAAKRSALREAAAFFTRALGVLEALPESPATLEQGFEIRLELRPLMGQLGEVRQSLDCLLEAATLAERSNDDLRRGRVAALMANPRMQLGEGDEALAAGARALEIAGRLGDLRLQILATSYLEPPHYVRGEYQRVIELATGGLSALPAEWLDDDLGVAAPPSIWHRCWLTMSLAERGNFREAAEYGAEAIRLAERTNQPFAIGLAHVAVTSLHLLKGDWATALARIERAIAVYRAGSVLLYLPWAVASSAVALARLGEAGAVPDRLREGEQLVEGLAAREVVYGQSPVCQWLGRASLLLGRLDEARRLGDRALATVPGESGLAAHALHLLGDIAAHPDRFDAEHAEIRYRQALALAKPRGMRPLVAHCHLGLGKLSWRSGKREQAQQHVATATALYREMDMQFWLERARAEMHQGN